MDYLINQSLKIYWYYDEIHSYGTQNHKKSSQINSE